MSIYYNYTGIVYNVEGEVLWVIATTAGQAFAERSIRRRPWADEIHRIEWEKCLGNLDAARERLVFQHEPKYHPAYIRSKTRRSNIV